MLVDSCVRHAPLADVWRIQVNQELHELPVEGVLYGIDLDARRIQHKGTNAGSDDVPGWWKDARAAYKAGNREQAWFLVGIMLHMIEDMGVPAHANGVYHQGNVKEFDNFEAMAAQKFDPDFSLVDRTDPVYADPSRYYAFSRNGRTPTRPTIRTPASSPRPGSPPAGRRRS